jgi:hypothetical protein
VVRNSAPNMNPLLHGLPRFFRERQYGIFGVYPDDNRENIGSLYSSVNPAYAGDADVDGCLEIAVAD